MEENKKMNETANAPSSNVFGSYYTPVKNPIKRKPVEPMEGNDSAFVLIFGVMTFMFIHFAFPFFSFGYTLWFVIMFAVSTIYLHSRERHASPFAYLCGLLSLTSAAANSVYINEGLSFLNVLLAAFLFVIYLGGISGALSKREGSYKLVINSAISVLFTPLRNLFTTFAAFGKSYKCKKTKVNINVLIGALLAIPFLVVIIPLLASSDEAFSGLIVKVFSNIWEDVFTCFAEFLTTLLVAPILISYAYSLKKNKNISDYGRKKRNGILANSLSVSFLSMISLTYLAYLFSQLAYFFSAFSGILPTNYEYSESVYARRGFYEIFVICIINITIIMLVNLLTKKNENGKFSLPLKFLQCFICAISIVFIITAMAKMALNIQHFGLSVNRLLVSLIELMMLVIIVFVVIHIFFPRVNYMQAVIVICSVLFIGFVYADVDAIVAKYNIEAYRSGALETLDVSYLGKLSDSAIPYIAELASDNTVDIEIRETAHNIMERKARDFGYSDYLTVSKDDFVMKYKEKPSLEEQNLTKRVAIEAVKDYFNSLDYAYKQDVIEYGFRNNME